MAHTYTYQLSNGKTLELEGDEQPTDTEVEEIANQQGVKLQPVEVAPAPITAPVETPVSAPPINTEQPTVETPEEPGWLSKAYHAITDPLIPKPESMRLAEESFTEDYPILGKIGSFSSDVIHGGTSPLDMATGGFIGAGALSRKVGLPTIAKAMEYGAKATGVPLVAHGASNVLDPESTWAERGTGLLEMAGGIGAVRGVTGPKTNALNDADLAAAVQRHFDSTAGTTPATGTSLNIKPDVTPIIKPGVDPNLQGGMGDPMLAGTQPQKATSGVLARDLQGAKPRFNIGSASYEPVFANDVDKALFIISQKTPSKRNADYLDFVMQSTGMDETQALEAAGKVRTQIRDAVKGQPSGEIKLSTLHGAKTTANDWANDPQKKTNQTKAIDAKPITSVTPATAPSLKIGTVVIIKSDKATPVKIKQAREAGFVFEGVNDEGHFRFRKTAETGPKQPVLESEVGQARPTSVGARQQLGPLADVKKSNIAAEAFNFPRAVMASWDASAPLRQGLGLIHKPAFWKSLGPMFKSWGSEEAFQLAQKEIGDRPLFKTRVGPVNPLTGQPKILPSFADDAGLKLTDLTDLTKREESMMSTWAEKVPGVRPSNRAYTTFLNKLRADTFEDLVKQGKVFGANAEVDLPLARELANFVNIASGRGNLGKLESSAVALNSLMFSPRLMAARLKMMDPRLYLMGAPQVRKEALKSLFAIAAAGNTITQLGAMAGGTVSNDPASSDFGKLKIGNTRIDPYGGFQQYVVAANRLFRPPGARIDGLEEANTGLVPFDSAMGMLGGKGQEIHSTTNTNEYDLWNAKGPYDPNWGSVAARFARGKANPVVGFALSLVLGKKELTGEDMDFSNLNPMENSIAQRFIPIIIQDLYELSQTDELPPEIKALVGAGAAFGMGTQTYED